MVSERLICLAFGLLLTLRPSLCLEEENNSTIAQNSTVKGETEELVQSETKDGKLEIIKRIKKVNADGSYTIGYEADDGSFKIESRDVLGNIKGTYGFVDDEGKIKRVSYSSSNASDVFGKPTVSVAPPDVPFTSSVVQRIPKEGKSSSTTRRPTVTETTSPSTTDSVIQSIARKRLSSTRRPNYNRVETLKTIPRTNTNSVVYSSAAPRVLLQRPSVTSPPKESIPFKSEGQIGRPDTLTEKITADKPVTEESVTDGGVYPESVSFDVKEHVFNLKQSLGDGDMPDVYNNDATATPRPLFTTSRPTRVFPVISSTTASPISVPRPNYVANYQREQLQHEATSPQYSSTEEASTTTDSPPAVPVVQIPPSDGANAEPLVAIRHPFQDGAILVPLSQLQGRIVPVESMQDVQEARNHYLTQQQDATVSVEVEKQNVRRLRPPPLRPLPVHVDQNGFIREMPPNVPTPYTLPIPITPIPVLVKQVPRTVKYVNNDVENDIDSIQPPVSTRDFQKLLNQLILRQKKLEQIGTWMHQKVQYQPLHSATTRVAPEPYFTQKVTPASLRSREYEYETIPRDMGNERSRYENHYVTSRPRLMVHGQAPVYRQEQSQTEEYLPVEVREMLLLRMLQLAMNPARPLEEGEESLSLASVTTPQYRRVPVRNVEILGEEDETNTPTRRRFGVRTKRFKEEDMDYME
ncbi:uncharacterized protein LOC143201319 [Rhynchophorus ferrugineus]|uniref:uncharacterized protein LOC143201319 n=1 Tax=Rhynchophorus ferrugineus TaxID=354439 RepID=UPI003FCD88B0